MAAGPALGRSPWRASGEDGGNRITDGAVPPAIITTVGNGPAFPGRMTAFPYSDRQNQVPGRDRACGQNHLAVPKIAHPNVPTGPQELTAGSFEGATAFQKWAVKKKNRG